MPAVVLIHSYIENGEVTSTRCNWLYRWGNDAEEKLAAAMKDNFRGWIACDSASKMIVQEYLANMRHWS